MPRVDDRAEEPSSVEREVLGVVCMGLQEEESMFDKGTK